MSVCEINMVETAVSKICAATNHCYNCPFKGISQALCTAYATTEETYKAAWEIIMKIDKGE